MSALADRLEQARRQQRSRTSTAAVTTEAVPAALPARPDGPFDSSEVDLPADAPFTDLGCLLVPAGDGITLRGAVDGSGAVYAVLVTTPDAAFELAAYAAAAGAPSWPQTAAAIAESLIAQGAQAHVDGDVVHAHVGDGEQASALRLIGVDGPRWLLRLTVRGENATDPLRVRAAEQFLRRCIVRRGDEPLPPGTVLPVRRSAAGLGGPATPAGRFTVLPGLDLAPVLAAR